MSYDLSEYYHYGLQEKKKLLLSELPSEKENKNMYIAATKKDHSQIKAYSAVWCRRERCTAWNSGESHTGARREIN